MASAGRGRGWGKNNQQNDLRRPGEPLNDSHNENDWVEKIRNLDLNDPTIRSPQSPFANLFVREPTPADLVRYQKLLYVAITNRNFARKFIFLFTNPTNNTYHILGILQPIYEIIINKQMWKQKPKYALSLTFFIGELYHNVKLPASSRPIIVLEKPLITCMSTILDTYLEEAMELVASQVFINGLNLSERNASEFNDLFIQMRNILITKNLSTKCRGLLMFMIDLKNNNFRPISEEMDKFYDNHLGTKTFSKIQRNSKNLNDIADELENDGENDVDICAELLEWTKNAGSTPDEPTPNSKEGNTPRAIRGSGAKESKDEFRMKDYKSSDPKNNYGNSRSNSNKNKYWEHDDRFSSDY